MSEITFDDCADKNICLWLCENTHEIDFFTFQFFNPKGEPILGLSIQKGYKSFAAKDERQRVFFS